MSNLELENLLDKYDIKLSKDDDSVFLYVETHSITVMLVEGSLNNKGDIKNITIYGPNVEYIKKQTNNEDLYDVIFNIAKLLYTCY